MNTKEIPKHFRMHSRHSQNMDLTEGSIVKGIIQFAIPLFLGQLLQQFYNMADAWVVGNFADNDAFAAVSSGGSLTFLIIGFFNGIAIGGGVIISRYFGAKDHEMVQKAIHTNFLFGILSSVLATAAGLAFIPGLLKLMKTPASVMPHSLIYFRIYFAGVSTVILYNICMSIMRALGDSLHPLYYLILSSLVNVALDLLFVAGFHQGVRGAAMATVLAQGLSVLLCLVRMYREKDESIRLDFRKLRFFVDSEEAVGYGIIHSRIVAPFFFLLAFSHCAAGVMRGCGRAFVPMVTMLLFWCGVRIIYVTMAVKAFPVFQTISWAYPLTWSLSSITFLIALFKLDWVHAFEKR